MTSTSESAQPIPLFSVPFRPFFLSGALFSVVGIIIWASVLNGWSSFAPYGGGYWWHSHEMLFGYVAAIVVGFLLTAVQNWTGQTSLKGPSLVVLWCVWLLARLILAVDLGIAKWLVMMIDLAFLPLAGAVLARLIIRAKLWRNLIFVPIIILMTIANGLVHWGSSGENPALVNQGSYSMVLLVTLLITVLGGRVFPMFTANGTGTKKVESIRILEICTIASTFLIALTYISGLILPPVVMAVLLAFSALCHFVRLLRWRFWVTLKTPLVWSLHLGYLGIAVGFSLMALHYLTNQIQLSTVLHGLTVGAIGGTILAMTTRVSLGHTGRKLEVGKLMSAAFIAIIVSFIVRVFYPFVSDDYVLSMTVAAILWVLAYTAYCVTFFPKLMTKRLSK